MRFCSQLLYPPTKRDNNQQFHHIMTFKKHKKHRDKANESDKENQKPSPISGSKPLRPFKRKSGPLQTSIKQFGSAGTKKSKEGSDADADNSNSTGTKKRSKKKKKLIQR